MYIQIGLGLALFVIGLILNSFGVRPWIDYSFITSWYGWLIIMDGLAQYEKGRSIFTNPRNFLILAFASSFFWWFYEWMNLALKNWAYPLQKLYTANEFGFLATIAFTTVIPWLIISSNIIDKFIYKEKIKWSRQRINRWVAYLLILLGLTTIELCVQFPLIFFPFTWVALMFIFDPINALSGKRSIIIEAWKGNYQLFIKFAIVAIFAGVAWETLNHLIPEWIYPIVPWFWKLPPPITTKYFSMPLAGLIGYIPFVWSAFSFVEFLGISVIWEDEN